MAEKVSCHFSSRATADETVSGGGAKDFPAATSVLICKILFRRALQARAALRRSPKNFLFHVYRNFPNVISFFVSSKLLP